MNKEKIKSFWEHFSHEADIGVRGYGASKEEAFEQAAIALMKVVTTEKVEPKIEIKIECEASDDELLFVDWLNALIFKMSCDELIFDRFKVCFSGQKIVGKGWGEKIDRLRHQPAVEVKGATYTELRVKQDPKKGWMAQCVVDV